MAFTLEIKTDNAAFYDDEGNFAPGAELARILQQVANYYDSSYGIDAPHHVIYDVNGNRVGLYRLSSL